MTDGQRLSGSEQQLRAALRSGALTADSLVWRKGWAEWQPARRVAELASSLPAPAEKKSEPRASKPSAAPVQMPPLVPRAPLNTTRPVAPALGVNAPSTPARAKPSSPGPHEPARDTLAPALAPSSFGSIGARRPGQAAGKRESGAPPPPPIRGRNPLPTLTEDDNVVSATATLRPPGAVPPPPRGVPAPALDANSAFPLEKRAPTLTSIPAFGPPGGALSTVPPAALAPRFDATPAAANEPARAATALPPVTNKALLIEPAPPSIEPALDSTLEVQQKVPPEARRTPIDPMLAVKRPISEKPAERAAEQRDSLVKIGRIGLDSRTVVMALSALSGALLVAVISLAVTRGHGKTPAPDMSASVSSALPGPAPSPPVGCKLGLPAARIFANVERSVPPYAAKFASENQLVLGFAASKTKGIGVRLSTDTLDVVQAFEEEGKDAVRGVVPLTHSGSLAFFVDRDDSALRSAHTVDEIPPFTLGVSDAGFSRVVAGSTSLVWPLEASVKITEPRSAQLADFGYGVTFRRGGQSGSVLLGFVASDGAKKSELAEIPNAPKLLGTPVIAGSAAGALVAFAGRDTPDAPWQLFVSLTKPGAAPSAARALVTGSAGGAISPTLAALAADRWLVQWTEGSSGQYQVHVQSFSADLSPVGQSVLVSPKGANAGQGSLASTPGTVTSLFILTTAGHDELWGATLTCQ
ncbi:MAG TPA: GYF domain-containing protein [Polyangiaceae bacterium]